MAQYTQYYDYLTDQGVMVPDTSVVLGEVQAMFQELFGDNLDLTPSTTQGRLIELFQRNRTFTINCMAAISNMLNLNRASGFILDDLGALFLISRQPATATTTTLNIAGVSGTVVPAGTRFQSNLGDVFVLTQNYTIGNPVSPIIQAQETGPIPCPPNSVTVILDNVSGMETVNNPGQPTLGQNVESDAQFRQRIKQSLNINSIAVLSAIKSNLEALPGVLGSYCYDNYTNQSVVIDKITVPAHSILVVVDGGDPAQIAQVLYEKKTAGTGYLSSSTDPDIEIVNQQVYDPAYGTAYTVTFARPDEVPLQINLTVTRQGYTGSDLTTAVQNAVIAWANGEVPSVDGLSIGGSVSPFEIAAAVSDQIPDIFINQVLVGEVGGTAPAATTISLDSVQKGTVSAENISVTITD